MPNGLTAQQLIEEQGTSEGPVSDTKFEEQTNQLIQAVDQMRQQQPNRQLMQENFRMLVQETDQLGEQTVSTLQNRLNLTDQPNVSLGEVFRTSVEELRQVESQRSQALREQIQTLTGELTSGLQGVATGQQGLFDTLFGLVSGLGSSLLSVTGLSSWFTGTVAPWLSSFFTTTVPNALGTVFSTVLAPALVSALSVVGVTAIADWLTGGAFGDAVMQGVQGVPVFGTIANFLQGIPVIGDTLAEATAFLGIITDFVAGDLISALVSAPGKIISGFQQGFGAGIESLKNVMFDIWGGVVSTLLSLPSILLSSLTTALGGLGASIASALGFDQTAQQIQSTAMNISTTIASLPRLVSNLPRQIWGFMQDLPGMIGQFFDQSISGMVGSILQALTTIPAMIQSSIISGLGNIGASVASAFGFNQFAKQITNVTSRISSFISRVPQLLSQLPARLWSFMKQIPSMIGSQITSALPSFLGGGGGGEGGGGGGVAQTAQNAAGGAASAVGSALSQGASAVGDFVGFDQGGVISKPTVALTPSTGEVSTIAENESEAIVPQSNIQTARPVSTTNIDGPGGDTVNDVTNVTGGGGGTVVDTTSELNEIISILQQLLSVSQQSAESGGPQKREKSIPRQEEEKQLFLLARGGV